jgi:hypothetical protein
MEPVRNKVQTEDAFWRRFTLPQEDRDGPWDGIGYRWFRSPNIVPLEHYRRSQKEGSPSPSETP